MALVSIGEFKWRMLRRIQRLPGSKGMFEQFRSWARKESELNQLRGLVKMGLVARQGQVYELTPAGHAAADMGEVDHAAYVPAGKLTAR